MNGAEWLGSGPNFVPLKRVCTVNVNTLPEDFPGEREIRYLDISGVSELGHYTEPESVAFEQAPPRARRIVRDGDVLVSTVRTYLVSVAKLISH